MKLGFALGALIVVAGLSEADAQPEFSRDTTMCAPSVTISGDALLVEKLKSELRQLGVRLAPSDGCLSTKISVEQLSSGSFVSVQEESGRSAYRQVGTIRMAAVWIDSWLEEDLVSDLLAVRTIPSRLGQPTLVSESSVLPPPVLDATLPNSDVSTKNWRVRMRYESSSADDIGWQGISAEACVSLSFACIGGVVRVSETKDPFSLPNAFGVYSQSSQDLLAALRIPIAVGRNTLEPHLALGLSRLHTTRAEACPEPEAPPSFCSAGDPPITRTTWAPRAEVGLTLSLPIATSLLLTLGGAVDLRPFGAASESAPMPMPPICDPADPACVDTPPSDDSEETIFPTDPEQFWRIAIGLELSL